jgi:hypothetical protein
MDVDRIERRTVIVLGHVDSQGGSRGNLRAPSIKGLTDFFSKTFRLSRFTKRAAYRVLSGARCDAPREAAPLL